MILFNTQRIRWLILLFLFLGMNTLFPGCKSASKSNSSSSTPPLETVVTQYIKALNQGDATRLKEIYSSDYQSLSPLVKPNDLNAFIKKLLENLHNYNFEVKARIREIHQGQDLAYVTMDWQLQTRGVAKETDPFANVQRMDIWKIDTSNNWRIFRTIIFREGVY